MAEPQRTRARAQWWAHAPLWVHRDQAPFWCRVCGHHQAMPLRVQAASKASLWHAKERARALAEAFERDAYYRDADVCGWCTLRLERTG